MWWTLSVLLFLVWAQGAAAATYFVAPSGCNETGPGTQAQPRCSITKGVQLMSSGDTLFLRQGTYGTPIDNNLGIPNGSPGNPTIIAGYPGEVVILTGGMGQEGATYTHTVENQMFKNLIFDGLGIWICCNRTRNMRLEQIEVKNVPHSGIEVYVGEFGTGMELVDVHLHHNGADTHRDHGFYGAAPGMLMERIHAHHNTASGIQIYNADGSPGSAMDCMAQCAHDTVIRNSNLHHNGLASGSTGAGATIWHGERIQFYNNLVWNNLYGVAFNAKGFTYGTGTSHSRIWNNTIVNNSGGTGMFIGNASAETLTDMIMQNNIVYGHTTNIFVANIVSSTFGTNLCNSLTAECTRNGPPAFEDAANGNLKITSQSDARNHGTTLTAFPNDYDYANRNQGGAWDIGAYEFTEGGGPVISTGNPIYVRKTVGSPSNDCVAAETPATAKQTIADACQCMTVRGKTMYIEGNGNTYVEEIDTGGACPILGGSGPSMATATVIEGYGSPLPTIQSPVGTGGVTVFLQGAGDQYLTLRKLIIDAANRAGNALALLAPAQHILVDQVEVKNAATYETAYLYGITDVTFTDVFVHDTPQDAVTLDGPIAGFVCQRCHLFSATGNGLNVTSAGTKTNITVRETEIRNNGSTGFALGTSTGTLIQNMLNHSNGGSGVVIRAGASGTRVSNNTIYGNTGVGLQCESGAPSTEFRNNVVYGNTGGNIVNNCGATVAKNLCAVTSVNCALGGDPLFVAAPTDLTLADGSPGIDTGDNIPSILTDYAGQPRQQQAQDIGAYERTQAAPPTQNVTVRQPDPTQAAWYF